MKQDPKVTMMQGGHPYELSIKVGKYTVIQTKKGALHALRNGEEWRDCVGDNLILSMAQEIERLRAQVACGPVETEIRSTYRGMQRVKIICGDRASGKTTLALQLAGESSTVFSVADIISIFSIGSALKSGVKTIIVEETDFNKITPDWLKSIVTEDKIMVDIKGEERQLFPQPNYIFCTGTKDSIPKEITDRRFTVIEVSK